MNRIAPRAVALAVGGTILTAVLAGSASAVSWGSVTSSYDGKSRSTAYGSFYNSNNVYAKNKVLSKDLAADGNTIYTRGQWYWNEGVTQTGGSMNTPEHNHTYYVTNYVQQPLKGASSSVRGGTSACVQLGWPVPDKCSVEALPSFSY
ncbi:hypothetical protein [Streptomyces sp. NPDC002779]|uniref:hypothetical protein n=1 Tax=Streptomyces sp. NPDC002779 TaxID=3364664 RepID=UPI0036891344